MLTTKEDEKWTECGTAFFAEVSDKTVLFGAGHCLTSTTLQEIPNQKVWVATEEVCKGLALDDFKLIFNNLDGNTEAEGIAIKELRDAYKTTLVIQRNATQQR